MMSFACHSWLLNHEQLLIAPNLSWRMPNSLDPLASAYFCILLVHMNFTTIVFSFACCSVVALLKDEQLLIAPNPSWLVQVWDVRLPGRELTTLLGHAYAVRRVVFSPHSPSILASTSYDMSVRMWDWQAPGDALLRSWDHHSEFAVGLDMSTLQEGVVASGGWDGVVAVWHQKGFP